MTLNHQWLSTTPLYNARGHLCHPPAILNSIPHQQNPVFISIGSILNINLMLQHWTPNEVWNIGYI